MKSVFPKDFDELAHQMATNDTIYEKFFRYTYDSIEFCFCFWESFLLINGTVKIYSILGISIPIRGVTTLESGKLFAKWFRVYS